MKNQRSKKPESIYPCRCATATALNNVVDSHKSTIITKISGYEARSKLLVTSLGDVRILEKSSTRFLRTKQTSPPLHNTNTYSEQKTLKDLFLEMVVELAGQKKHKRKIKTWRKEMDSTETEPSDCGSPKRVISSFRRPISSSTFIVMALSFWLLRGAASSLVSGSVFVQAGGKKAYKEARSPFKISIDVQRRDPQKSRGLHPYP
jgi:hypothetical protein